MSPSARSLTVAALNKFERVIWIVLDSVGIGAMPDWQAYLDPEPGDTLGHIAQQRPIKLPNLCALGLGNIKPLPGLPPAAAPLGSYGRCALDPPARIQPPAIGRWSASTLPNRFPCIRMGFRLK